MAQVVIGAPSHRRNAYHRHQKHWLAALTQPEQDQLIHVLHRLQAALADSKI